MVSPEFIDTSIQVKARALFSLFHNETGFRDLDGWSRRRQNELTIFTDRFRGAFGIRIERATTKRIVEALEMNRIMALLTSTDEYGDVVNNEKSLRGRDVTLAESICIDGRIPTIHRDGRVIKVHETMAGLLDVEYSTGENTQGKPLLRDKRFVAAIEDEAKRGPLLEVLVAHADLDAPHHGCGAMANTQVGNPEKYPPGTDLIQANLDLHQEAATAIDLTYNEAAEIHGKSTQQKTAITAVYDTRTMGVMLGYNYNRAGVLYTTDIVHEIVNGPNLFSINNNIFQPGQLEHEILKPEKLVKNGKIMYDLTKKLLDLHNPFHEQVDRYIKSDSNLNQLSEKQQQALRFYLARTTAFQYLTKSYEGRHPFVDHAETLQSISSDGAAFGQFLLDQVFVASPNPEEVVKHIITQCNLMNKEQKQVKPYLLFVSSALSESQLKDTAGDGARERAKGTNIALLSRILHNEEILERIRSGELVVVPISIHDKTRDVIEVGNGLGAF